MNIYLIGIYIYTFSVQEMGELKIKSIEESSGDSSIKDEATHHKDRQHPAL